MRNQLTQLLLNHNNNDLQLPMQTVVGLGGSHPRPSHGWCVFAKLVGFRIAYGQARTEASLHVPWTYALHESHGLSPAWWGMPTNTSGIATTTFKPVHFLEPTVCPETEIGVRPEV